MWYERIIERGLIPDEIVRRGIRLRLRRLLRERAAEAGGDPAARLRRLADELRASPLVLHADAANRQHYELPAAFFREFLGPRLKYSCCYWPDGVGDLAAAELAMLDLTCERALLEDGMRVLDLGCGWGALALYIAERYPACHVVAVSNSVSQRDYVAGAARRVELDNVTTVTADVSEFVPDETFDRIVSVEMLEHVRNYEALFARLATWLAPGGRLFVHVFSHARYAYTFHSDDPDDWMGRHFFSGGTMPAHDLFLEFAHDLRLVDRWRLDGTHYALTLEEWLRRYDARAQAVRPLLEQTYGEADGRRAFVNWRVFFLACAETFAYAGGGEWGVSHYLFSARRG